MNEQLPCQWAAALNNRAPAGRGFQINIKKYSAPHLLALIMIICGATKYSHKLLLKEVYVY